MPITPLQSRLIHVAAREADLNDQQYRILLANVTGKESSKHLDQAGFEDVMAVLEDMGFEQRGESPDYWRKKVGLRGQFANSRLVHRMTAMSEECRYPLMSLVLRFSGHRTAEASKLTPLEAHHLIEAMKDMSRRTDDRRSAVAAEV